ncbi:TPA: IS607 family transposase [Candidatus Poribacteria bacterium]|nr:IS607 family transposase [Candidatus Poribacteria bacterium]
MPERYFPISEAAKRLGVHHTTLRKWANEGKIGYTRTVGGRRRFPESEINRLLGKETSRQVGTRACVYARVSTKKQEEAGNLERQRTRVVNYCIEKGYAVVGVYSDIASGLNANRRGLMKLLTAVKKGKVDIIVVEFQDRLARFGYEFLQRYCLDNGVTIEIINQQESEDLNQELVNDLIAIVSSFSARIYGCRGGRVAKKVATLLEEEKCIE